MALRAMYYCTYKMTSIAACSNLYEPLFEALRRNQLFIYYETAVGVEKLLYMTRLCYEYSAVT